MAVYEFGNDPRKIERYLAFWNRSDVRRPLVGFSLVGWFPFGQFAVCRGWPQDSYLTLEMIDPEAFLDDHVRMLREGEFLDDDVFRGACPGQVALPWLPAMLGCRLRILPENVLGEERHLSLAEALEVRIDPDNPWRRKYFAFADALVKEAAGRFPVSHSAELGPADLHAVLRGHTESLLDLGDDPKRAAALLWRMGEIFCELTEALWQRLPRFAGGYFDAQYSIWAPGPVARLQEDATAVYSPALYRRFVQPVDRMMGARFEYSFIHLHASSMFLLEDFLDVREIRCLEINKDAVGPSTAELIPYFQRVQRAGRPLVVRGYFRPDEVRLLMDSLEPRGLHLNLLVNDLLEAERLRPLVGL